MTTITDLSPGDYVVDTQASHIGFVAKLILGLKVKGRFDRFESAIEIGSSPAESSMRLTLWTDSVQTGIKMRDGHLRADNVFAVGRFPTLEFHSTAIVESGAGYDVEGMLRVRDVTQPVAFHLTPVEQPGPARFTARVIVAPADFGVSRPGTTKPVDVVLDITLAAKQLAA